MNGYVPPTASSGPVYPSTLQLGLPTLPASDKHKIKGDWNEKREKKLHTAYNEIMKDQYMSVAEVKQCLLEMGYDLNDQQCLSFLYTIDKNRDGRISWEEFRDGVKELVTKYAKNGKGKKDKKDKDKGKDKDKEKKDKKDKDKKDKKK